MRLLNGTGNGNRRSRVPTTNPLDTFLPFSKAQSTPRRRTKHLNHSKTRTRKVAQKISVLVEAEHPPLHGQSGAEVAGPFLMFRNILPAAQVFDSFGRAEALEHKPETVGGQAQLLTRARNSRRANIMSISCSRFEQESLGGPTS